MVAHVIPRAVESHNARGRHSLCSPSGRDPEALLSPRPQPWQCSLSKASDGKISFLKVGNHLKSEEHLR